MVKLLSNHKITWILKDYLLNTKMTFDSILVQIFSTPAVTFFIAYDVLTVYKNSDPAAFNLKEMKNLSRNTF